MCGIVAAVSRSQDVVPELLEGLRRLEYRGYDSCGVAVGVAGGLERVRSTEKVAALTADVRARGLKATVGISHTRWATHGGVTVANAHPQFSGGSRIAIVHNGIIENYEEFKEKLVALGDIFEGQTDTEVVAHLFDHAYSGDLLEAVRKVVVQLRGSFAIAACSADEPDRIVVARRGMPLVVGIGKGQMMAASDMMALAGECQMYVRLENGDVVDLHADRWEVYTQQGDSWVAVARRPRPLEVTVSSSELGPHRHYMQKEIFEQPAAVARTLEGIDAVSPKIFGEDADRVLQGVDRVLMLACGTSSYAAQTARCWIEEIAGIPAEVEIASEYRYRVSVPSPTTLVVAISQSGETADTREALRHATELGMERTLAICNVSTSSMVSESRLAFITKAGPEIGVASTKAFTTQLVALFLLALTLAKGRGRLSAADEAKHLADLASLPGSMSVVLGLEPKITEWAAIFAQRENALFLGRGLHYPIALEGALKLKEISYIHAEAYPAGELKHGPLALVDSKMPVVTVAPNDRLLEKLKSNMQEVRARGGELFVFADHGTRIQTEPGVRAIVLPEHFGLLSPVLHVLPLQLLAYHTACVRGTDIDKPRNLAKSVTVE